VQVWQVFAAASALGVLAAVERPARQAMVGEIVGKQALRPAISQTNVLGQVGGLIGPATAGVVIDAFGQGWAYAANAVLCVAVATFGVVESAASFAPTHEMFLVAVVAVGFATLSFLTTAITVVQLAAEPAFRGRVRALYSPMLLGGHALGGLLQGWLTNQPGVRHALALTGLGALGACAVVTVGLLRTDRRRLCDLLPGQRPSRDVRSARRVLLDLGPGNRRIAIEQPPVAATHPDHACQDRCP